MAVFVVYAQGTRQWTLKNSCTWGCDCHPHTQINGWLIIAAAAGFRELDSCCQEMDSNRTGNGILW